MMSTKNHGSPEVRLYVGTRKGGFCFISDPKRKNWTAEGPFFGGTEVNYLGRDLRTGRLWCAQTSTWWGTNLHMSEDDGRTWNPASMGISFSRDRGLILNRIWRVVPDRESRPDVLWGGVDPGAIFRSDNGGGGLGWGARGFVRSIPFPWGSRGGGCL